MELEQQAKQLGWKPQAEFRGAPESWVDAETFVRRGEEVMPILKKNNEKLLGELSLTKQELAALRQTLQASQEAIGALKDHQTETTKREVARVKAELRAELIAAREAGDETRIVRIEDELLDIKLAEKAPTPTPAAPSPPPAPANKPAPEIEAWYKDHDWFGTDKRKTRMFTVVAQELRESGSKLFGVDFLNAALEETETALGTPENRPANKVEGGGGSPSTNSGGVGTTGKGYKDLPADAKAACVEQGKKLVGPGRAFKDAKDWQAHYAEQYFTYSN